MIETVLIIIFTVIFFMYPIRKGGISAAYNDPQNVAVMAVTAIVFYIMYSIYIFIKSKKQK